MQAQLLVSLTLLVVLACAGEIHLYTGEVDPAQTAVVMREPSTPDRAGARDDELQDWGSEIIGIDGTAFDVSDPVVRVLPGPHVVTIQCGGMERWRKSDAGPTFFRSRTYLEFEAEAGATYEVHCVGTVEGYSHESLEARIVRTDAGNVEVASGPGCRGQATEHVRRSVQPGDDLAVSDTVCECADARCMPDHRPWAAAWH